MELISIPCALCSKKSLGTNVWSMAICFLVMLVSVLLEKVVELQPMRCFLSNLSKLGCLSKAQSSHESYILPAENNLQLRFP